LTCPSALSQAQAESAAEFFEQMAVQASPHSRDSDGQAPLRGDFDDFLDLALSADIFPGLCEAVTPASSTALIASL